jgi:hypothetical protein
MVLCKWPVCRIVNASILTWVVRALIVALVNAGGVLERSEEVQFLRMEV